MLEDKFGPLPLIEFYFGSDAAVAGFQKRKNQIKENKMKNVLPNGFLNFHRVFIGFTEFHQVWLGLTGFDWVWLGVTGLCYVLLGFTGFY